MLGGHTQVLNQKTLGITSLLILILSITFTFLSPTLALTNSIQRQKVETLIEILDNDNKGILFFLNNFDANNIAVPQIAKIAHNEGLIYAQEAINLMSEEKYVEAGVKAIEAMQKFEETLRLLQNITVDQTQSEVYAEEAIHLKANLTRTMDLIERLENLTTKAETIGYDTIKIENRFAEIKKHLDNAFRELASRNLEHATEELSIAKTLLNELKDSIVRLTNLVTNSNSETYLKEAEIRVSTIKANITLSATLTTEVKEEAIVALQNSEVSLANARDLIEENNVDDAIEELREAKKWEESSRKITEVATTQTSVVQTNDSISSINENSISTNESTIKTESATSK